MTLNNLLKVAKPLRYTGGECGEVIKDKAGKLSICLTFPDVYEIGMSHLGIKLLYNKLNQEDAIACERFFAPWQDAYEILKDDIMVSLESKTPIKQFDVLGFSLQYELSFVTAIQLLKMGSIPIKSVDRDDSYPIIIAGGSCIYNPAPLSPFIDVFFIGEMDTALTKAMIKLHQYRADGKSKREQLEMLDEYPFTYVPAINPDKCAKREVYKEFTDDTDSCTPFIPLMPIIQDRVAVEISRGCTNGCRFCQAGLIYRPVREKGVNNISCTAMRLIDETGYQEMSALSLDSGDYSKIDSLLNTLADSMTPKNVSVTLPSLRAETVKPEILDKISSVRKSGFTIAPEAGTQRLRDIINKNLSEQDILDAATYAKSAGYNGVKLYFMCGLPYETDEDIVAIADLAAKINYAVRSVGSKRSFAITVAVSNFVPKPHTPFERFGQNSAEELIRKHRLLKDATRGKKNVTLKTHDPFISILEAAIAKGDAAIMPNIIEQAVNKGFYLDAWSEHFSKERWNALFEELGYNLEDFSTKSWGDDEVLPWHMINIGVKNEWLLKERDKAKNIATTVDCRNGNCSSCGVCDAKIYNRLAAYEKDILYTPAMHSEQQKQYLRYEIIFEKLGVAIFMSALDLSRIFSNLLLSVGVSLKFSEGFNPMPRIIIQSPAPVGVGGNNESLLLEADMNGLELEKVKVLLNSKAPNGMIIKEIYQKEWPKNISDYKMEYMLDNDSFAFLINAIDNGEAFYKRLDKKGNVKTIELANFMTDINREKHIITVRVTPLGGFHFPDFFRHSKYDKTPTITRVTLTNE